VLNGNQNTNQLCPTNSAQGRTEFEKLLPFCSCPVTFRATGRAVGRRVAAVSDLQMRFEQTHVSGHIGPLVAALLVDVALRVYTDQQLRGNHVRRRPNAKNTLTDIVRGQTELYQTGSSTIYTRVTLNPQKTKK
jgi:hypothetical protein